jgi:monofunctional biosynthetic peptidoglycan transglycosylase
VYLNVAEFGRGVFGVGAAADQFYGKSAKSLSTEQAARLAAVLPSPKRYSVTDPGRYVQRRTRQIQRQMRKLGGTGYLARL